MAAQPQAEVVEGAGRVQLVGVRDPEGQQGGEVLCVGGDGAAQAADRRGVVVCVGMRLARGGGEGWPRGGGGEGWRGRGRRRGVKRLRCEDVEV